MCGRFTLQTPATDLTAMFDGLRFPSFEPRYNICPTQPAMCIRWDKHLTVEAIQLRWGLVPSWAKDLKVGARMINARSETVASKPSFRSAFKKRRCLVIADGFYEWMKIGRTKQPYYITLTDHSPFAMAGLWETWNDPHSEDSSPIETCTILTTEANEIMQPLHDRMPVILDSDQQKFWLDTGYQDQTQLEKTLVPYDSQLMQTYPVSPLVNKVGNDTAECIEPIDLDAGKLF